MPEFRLGAISREGKPRPVLIVTLTALCVAGGLTHARSLPLFVPAAVAVLLSLTRGRRFLSPAVVTCAVGAVYAVVVFLAASSCILPPIDALGPFACDLDAGHGCRANERCVAGSCVPSVM